VNTIDLYWNPPDLFENHGRGLESVVGLLKKAGNFLKKAGNFLKKAGNFLKKAGNGSPVKLCV
jgi:hypothetical protein